MTVKIEIARDGLSREQMAEIADAINYEVSRQSDWMDTAMAARAWLFAARERGEKVARAADRAFGLVVIIPLVFLLVCVGAIL